MFLSYAKSSHRCHVLLVFVLWWWSCTDCIEYFDRKWCIHLNPTVFSAPSWAYWGGEAADPALGGIYGLLWPQHAHHRESFVRTCRRFLWLQWPWPWGQGGVRSQDGLHFTTAVSFRIGHKDRRSCFNDKTTPCVTVRCRLEQNCLWPDSSRMNAGPNTGWSPAWIGPHR